MEWHIPALHSAIFPFSNLVRLFAKQERCPEENCLSERRVCFREFFGPVSLEV